MTAYCCKHIFHYLLSLETSGYILIRRTLFISLTPWSRILLEKLIIAQLVMKSTAIYGTWRFITVFRRAHHLTLFWARWVQSKPSHPVSLRSILILFSHLYICLLNGLFPSHFLTKILHAFLTSSYMLHILPISSSMYNQVWGTLWQFVRCKPSVHWPNKNIICDVCEHFCINVRRQYTYWIFNRTKQNKLCEYIQPSYSY